MGRRGAQEAGRLPIGHDRGVGDDPAYLGISIVARRAHREDRSGGRFLVPRGSLSGRLRFTNGAHRVAIRADLQVRGLYHAYFEDCVPAVEVQGDTVTIQYPQVPYRDWVNHRPERLAEVALNASILWDVGVRGGASRLVADLRGLRLGSLSLDGGVSRVEVVLPAPSGTVAVAILGGASNVALRRPEGVAARLRVEGGATNLTFDARHIGAAGGDLDLRDENYDGTGDRFDLIVTGGANNLIVDKQRAMQVRPLEFETEGVDLDLESER